MMNRNINWMVLAIVAVATFSSTPAFAQTAAPRAAKTPAKSAAADDWLTRAKAAIMPTFTKLTYRYKPADEQKAKLEKVLIAQYKDLQDHDKVSAPKIKEFDEQIATLQKEIDAINKRKSVYTGKRVEIKLDHKAELDSVFTEKQRVDYLVNGLKSGTTYRYWSGFSAEQQASLIKQFEAAALKVIQAGPEESDKVYSAVRRELYGVVQNLLTPEVRRAGEAKYTSDSVMRSFYRIKLTDAQKEQVRELCDKEAKQRSELSEKYRQLDKDRDALRKSMYQNGTTASRNKIYAEISEKVLTEEQRKAIKSRSSRSSRSRSSRRPSGSASRRTGRATSRPSVTRTPK
jgi:hypothetical protein